MTHNDVVLAFKPAVLPDFSVWQRQREQCKQRRYMVQEREAMVCMHELKRTKRPRAGRAGHVCIAQREKGSPCGPDGRLFEPREVEAV